MNTNYKENQDKNFQCNKQARNKKFYNKKITQNRDSDKQGIKYKGKITIIRNKGNIGVISLDDGTKTQPIPTPQPFEDGDSIEVIFSDLAKTEIKFMKVIDDTYYYGVVISVNEQKNLVTILCNYPKIKGTITKNGIENLKLSDKVKFNISKITTKFFPFTENVQKIEIGEYWKTLSPIIQIFEGKFYSVKKNNDQITRVNIKEDKCKYINFTRPELNEIYIIIFRGDNYIYSIQKLNYNNINEILACYRNSKDKVKLRLIDKLIQGLSIKNFEKTKLIKDKKILLKKMIASLPACSLRDKYIIELQQLDYNPN